MTYPIITINTSNPDPTNAINAFLWCMAKARELGMMPPTEHILAEHMFRRSAKIIYYSSMSGVTSLVMDEEAADGLEAEDALDFAIAVMKRRKERHREKRAAVDASVDRNPEGGDACGSIEDESAVAESQTPNPLYPKDTPL